MKKQPTEWEKISTNDTPGKPLIFKIHRTHAIQQQQKIQLKNGKRT